MSTQPVIVIGAGIGGLSAAIHLAASGIKVQILEANDAVGGKMGEIRTGGYRWDTGPSVITMRHVFENLFAEAGRNLDDYLSLRRIEPLTRYFYPDGFTLDASDDPAFMEQQISKINTADMAGYNRYLRYVAELHRITGPVFIYDIPPRLSSIFKVSPLDILKVDGLRTMQQAIQSYVTSPYLRQLLGRFATYVGGSPYHAPATLNVIAHVEMNQGVWYPDGGIYSIARAFQQLAEELGVSIRTGCRVEKIQVDGTEVTGLRLHTGEFLPAKHVIANVDVATVYEKLLQDYPSPKRAYLVEPSCSGFLLLLGVKAEHPQLAHHNIFFSTDYEREFRQIFDDRVPPDNPTIYASLSSKSTPQDAPTGHENWFVMVNAPALSPAWDWHKEAPDYRDLVLSRLADRGYDLRDSVDAEIMLTPHDIERTTGAYHGALYGASPNNRWAAFRKPHNRSRDIKGLYFAGGTTHPGGGVPMVTLSGKVAARFVLEDLA